MAESEHWKEHERADDLSLDEEKILEQMGLDANSRRNFLKKTSAASLSFWASTHFTSEAFAKPVNHQPKHSTMLLNEIKVNLRINDTVKTPDPGFPNLPTGYAPGTIGDDRLKERM